MLDYTLLEFEEAVPFLGESRSPVATINAPPQRERNNRNNIANRTLERETNRPDERDTFRTTREQDHKPRQRERSAERQPPQSRNRAPAPRGERETFKTPHVSTAARVGCAPAVPDAQVPVIRATRAKLPLRRTNCAWTGSHGRDLRT